MDCLFIENCLICFLRLFIASFCRRAYQLVRTDLACILEEQALTQQVLALVPDSSLKDDLKNALASCSSGSKMLATLEGHLLDMPRNKVSGGARFFGLETNHPLNLSVCTSSKTFYSEVHSSSTIS